MHERQRVRRDQAARGDVNDGNDGVGSAGGVRVGGDAVREPVVGDLQPLGEPQSGDGVLFWDCEVKVGVRQSELASSVSPAYRGKGAELAGRVSMSSHTGNGG